MIDALYQQRNQSSAGATFYEVRPLPFTTLDTNYLGIRATANAFLIDAPDGAVLCECGCAVSFDLLCTQLAQRGLKPRDLRALFVTHIHLDHAGSAGHFAREGVQVFVHPRGARHLMEPSRLIAGSRAVHGALYDQFYGDPIAIDAKLLHAVEHDALIEVAGLRVRAIETQGHARHHHAWTMRHAEHEGDDAELLFVGDVLGMISPGSSHISIPVPPSDIDIPAWRESIARLRTLPRNTRAILTHGGERELGPHLDRFTARMNEELPLLATLVEVARTDAREADARYQAFLEARARAEGVSEALIASLLGRTFRSMNLDGIRHSINAGLFESSVE